MSNYFSTEIGRIHCEEMVARGLRYQAAAADERSKERQSCLTVPRQKRSYRRVLVTVGLSFVFMVLVSSVAFAYPANPGSSDTHSVVGSSVGTTSHVTASSSFDPLWIVVLLGVAIIAAGSAFILSHRHPATA